MIARGAVLLIAAAVAAVAAPVPTPDSWFGHRMGADRKLVGWDKVVGYFDALAAGTERVRVERIGSTVDGRPMIAVFIADGSTLRNLDRYRDIQARLADPRRTPDVAAEQLIKDGKTIVMITCSIHSTEVASTLTSIEYAHRLITEDTPKTRAILANTLFILVPSLNPDGVETTVLLSTHRTSVSPTLGELPRLHEWPELPSANANVPDVTRLAAMG